MMNCPGKSWHLSLGCILALVAVQPASAQKASAESAAFFAGKKALHLDIEIGAKPLSLLRLEPRTYVRASITNGGTVYPDIGIHLRGGLGSFRPVDGKAGFTIKMNKFGAETTFRWWPQRANSLRRMG